MSEVSKQTIVFDEYSFDVGGRLLLRAGEIVSLEPMAGRVLAYLLENGGRVISKNELLDAVWRDVFTTEDVLKRAVSQIRRALGDDANNPRFIETHHRRGYRFILNSDESQNTDGFSKPNILSADSSEPNFDCFIGREAEITFLQNEFRRTARGENGQPILISGDAGIGKTQLAAHFTDWAQGEHNAVPLRVRFFDYEAAYLPPFDVFFDVLSEACAGIFGWSGKTDKNETRRRIETELEITLPDEIFADSKGERRASSDVSRAIAPLAESFVRLSRRPLVLLLDDVQWADDTSRRIIGYLMRIAKDAPLLIVALTRRDDAENGQKSFARWLQAQAAYRSFTTLNLAPLSAENCRLLVNDIFRNRLDSDTLTEKDLLKLHTATGGNAYFIVETLRLLINEKAIEKLSANNEISWRWRGISDVPLPETVRMAARAKLSDLTPETQDLIECAAVLGDTFQVETLEFMLKSEGGKWTGEMLDAHLDKAIAAQILSEQHLSSGDDCQFYHTTLRRAVYMDLSPRRRRRLHARAANALETSYKESPERIAAALAAHREIGGEFQSSFRLNVQACRAAAHRFDWAEAAELLSRAERVQSNFKPADQLSDSEFLKFLSLQGEVYLSVGRRVEAEKNLFAASNLAREIGDENESAIIFSNLGRTRILLGKYHEAIPVLEKSLAVSESQNNRENACAALIQIASAKYALCEFEESCEILQKIIAEEPAASYNRVVALGKLGWTRVLQSRYREARILLEEALEFHRAAGDLRERAVLSMCLNSCEQGLGNYESAIEYAMKARREAQLVGEPYNESVAMMRIARARIAQGLYAEAEILLREAREKQKNLDAPHAKAETIWMIGRLQSLTNENDNARLNLETALEMIRKIGDRDDEFRILLDQSVLQNRLGNFADALELLNESQRIAEEIDILEGIGGVLIEKTHALLNLKEKSEALKFAERAVEILSEINSGELWRAFHALARALQASKKFPAEIESNLRRALELLEKIRGQFLESDEKYQQITVAHNAPARDLYNFLKSNNRETEAEIIRRLWLIDPA